MNGFLDDFLVGLVLVAGFGYAAYSLGPKKLRARMALGLAGVFARAPGLLGLRGLARRLEAAGNAKAGGACGGCDTCGSEQPAQKAADASGEVRIPLTSIGKRR
jgi:hypothetical protein